MLKNLRNKLAVLALIALGLAFGNALGSQPQVTHDVLQLLGHEDVSLAKRCR